MCIKEVNKGEGNVTEIFPSPTQTLFVCQIQCYEIVGFYFFFHCVFILLSLLVLTLPGFWIGRPNSLTTRTQL